MKKLLLILFAGVFILSSCDKETISAESELDVLTAKTENKQKESEHEDCSEDGKCETAFARFCDCENLNTCFLDLGFNRWGWSVKLNEPKTYNFGFYAGAGQCDLDKGTPVGNVKVIYQDDGSVSVDHLNMMDGFELKEFHFYAGDSEIPVGKNGKSTVAPGQYYNEGDADGKDGVYVILHAVVCGEY